MTKVSVPQLAWYGDTELELEFPDSWDVSVCKHKGYDAPALDDAGFRKAFANPIGTPTIKEMARGKKEVCILFDDMSRATPSADIIPYVLEELAAAGIKDDQIRFIAAIGAHGSMTAIDFTKKLGRDVMSRFRVYNHNPYENCTSVGPSPNGIPMQFNAEFMMCDLKIGIGSIVPHPFSGFGGGSKIVLPGVASITTIDLNHTRLGPDPTVGIGKYEGNILKADMNDAARMAGLDVKIDCIFNLKRQVTHLFVGDVVDEHVAGVKVAREYWATDVIPDCDIVVTNAFAKANEMLLTIPVSAPLLKSSGGDLVILCVTPEGQINHYWSRSFGKNLGGRAYKPKTALPVNTSRLTVMQPYPDFVGADWVAPYDMVNFTRDWSETLKQLKETYGDTAKVAVVPDGTAQYFPAEVVVC
jgi:nickel-dependent lactate racemase